MRKLRYTTLALIGVFIVIAFVIVGEGAGSRASSGRPDSFGWIVSRIVPGSWSSLHVPGSPWRLPLPSGWAQTRGDAGTRTAELAGPTGEIAGYLNATPQQGSETPANWQRFRPAHNRAEGDRDVRLLAAAGGLSFGGGRGSCVLDAYRTATDARYREIACLLVGGSGGAVVVAAAPPSLWASEAPVLKRAVAGFEI